MRTCKLYFIRVAIVTGIEKSGLYTSGRTYSNEIDRWFIAKSVTRDYIDCYKLISNGTIVYADHNDTEYIGDCFAKCARSLTLYLKRPKRFLSKKQLYNIEDGINKEDDGIPDKIKLIGERKWKE